MVRSAARLLPAIASVLLVASAAQAQAPAKPGTRNWEESGEASWYGGRHHGRRTSSGDLFDMAGMTAAHATLPLGTRVRVTVQDTGNSVVVTVNDRQPAKRFRIIDLSHGAASRIGILSRGTAMVTLSTPRATEPVEVAEAPDAPAELSANDAAPSISAGAPRPRGQPRTRRADRAAGADRPCCRAPSATPVRHSAPRRAAPRRL